MRRTRLVSLSSIVFVAAVLEDILEARSRGFDYLTFPGPPLFSPYAPAVYSRWRRACFIGRGRLIIAASVCLHRFVRTIVVAQHWNVVVTDIIRGHRSRIVESLRSRSRTTAVSFSYAWVRPNIRYSQTPTVPRSSSLPGAVRSNRRVSVRRCGARELAGTEHEISRLEKPATTMVMTKAMACRTPRR